MNRILTWICCAAVSFHAGCATSLLWRDTNPRARLFIDQSQITEEQLKAKHVEYESINSPVWNGYFVKKSQAQQLGDIAIRIFVTPITVTLDTAMTVIVIGAGVMAQSRQTGQL